MALYLTEKDVNGLLTMDIALDAVEEGFRQQADGKATNSLRSRLNLPKGAFNFMSAAVPGMGVMGLKAYAIAGGNAPRFYVQISSTETGELLAIIEASDMGQIRTGAASGVATKYMARQGASTVGIIGSGYQARTQLQAVCRVRRIEDVKVFSRTPARREKFAAEMTDNLGINVSVADNAELCVQDSDVVITITNSSKPVLEGEWLRPGTHINAAGANHWMRRELDDEAVSRADVVATDDLEQARIECGDLIYPIEKGIARWEQVRSLSEVVAGRTPGRTGDADITLFDSQGVALEDVAIGIKVYELAKERRVGREISF